MKRKGMSKKEQLTNTLEDLNGDTYTLCEAETFFGDISGRFGNGDTLGDPGD